MSVVGRLDAKQLELMGQTIRLCEQEPRDDIELRAQRVAELEFHNLLADRCPNALLAFVCRFLNDLLRDLMVYKNAWEHRHFGEANVCFHGKLLQAFRDENAEAVRRLMAEHMLDAENHMHEMEVHVCVQQLLMPAGQRHQ